MSISLSINLNKVALIRNSREGNFPSVTAFAKLAIDAGVDGITVHPRPDQRHIRPEDCHDLSAAVAEHRKELPQLEFNIEGNPGAGYSARSRADFGDYPGFIDIIEAVRPDQATLVPDSDQQLTSDHGFDLQGDQATLASAIERIKSAGSRVSLFMDPDVEQISRARDIGADRIELYTGPFAAAFETDANNSASALFEQHCRAAEHAHAIGLDINAGHDLNLDNLVLYRDLPYLAEVSIGHALTVDALKVGLGDAITRYRAVLSGIS